jgi:hypothetical protein
MDLQCPSHSLPQVFPQSLHPKKKITFSDISTLLNNPSSNPHENARNFQNLQKLWHERGFENYKHGHRWQIARIGDDAMKIIEEDIKG